MRRFLSLFGLIALTLALLPFSSPAAAATTQACSTSARVTISNGTVTSTASATGCTGTIEVFTSATANGSTTTQSFTGTGTLSAQAVKSGSSGCSGQAYVKINGRTVANSSSSSSSCQGFTFPW